MPDERDSPTSGPPAPVGGGPLTLMATVPVDEPASPAARTILDLSEVHDPAVVAAAVGEVDPHDAARMLAALPPARAGAVVPLMDAGHVAQMFTEMDPAWAAEVIESMPATQATAVLAEMDPDDRVDLLDELDEAKHDELVAGLDAEEQAEVMELERHAPDTAGGIMTTQVTKLYERISVQDAIETLRAEHEKLEQMFYAYVVNRRGLLVGVLSMRDLILARPDQRLRDIMIGRDRVRALPADMDQEEVADLFHRYHYLAMPVVDRHDRLVGLVTADDVADVVQEELTEDIHKLFGAGAEERLSSPWHFSFRKRIGWLIVNLATAFAAASVVAAFSGTIDRLPILAVFMPIIAGMGGNASAQAMAVAVRGLSSDRVDRRLLRHVLVRETYCGLLTGLVIGVITAAIAFGYYETQEGGALLRATGLGLIVFCSLVINHTLANLTGAGIPFLMRHLGFDPAQSATIFATTVTDVVGFFALLGLAAVTAVRFGLL